MATLGKCWNCQKTVYSTEGFTFGPMAEQKCSHKQCFKCAEKDCTWKLEVGTYKSYGGLPYCQHHRPAAFK